MTAHEPVATPLDNDDMMILTLIARFFGDETVQKKMDRLAKSPDEKDETGWENWLKFELKFFIEFSANNQTIVDIEPPLYKKGRHRADLLLNNTKLVEIKRKIKMTTCFREMKEDFEKYFERSANIIDHYEKVYFVGIFHEPNGDTESLITQYFNDKHSIEPLFQTPLTVGAERHQVVILKHLLKPV